MATSSKEQILASIRQHTTERFAMPNLSKLEHEAQTFANPVEAFSKALEQSGGHAALLPKDETLGAFIAKLYPQAKTVANTITQLPGAEALPGKVFNPDEVTNPAELNGTDLAIIASKMGVAENACCYIEDNVRHRAVFFISEALVIVLNSKDIVNNMHEA